MPRRRAGPGGIPAGPLRSPLDYVLATRAKVAALRVLAAAGSALTGREVARRAGLQLRSAQRALADLVAMGVVDRVVGGRDHLMRLNRVHRLVPVLAAMFDREADGFRALRERLAAALASHAGRRGVLGVALFGSAARGDDTLASDLDVLVVTADRRAGRGVEERFARSRDELRASFGVEARLLVLTLAEARRLHRARRPPISEIVRDALVLSGPPLPELLER